MRQQIAVVELCVVDPARGAGSDHRKHAALGQAVQKLRAFLHDREVGAEVDVVDALEAESAESCDHLAGDRRSDRIAELLAQGCSDSRSRLNNHVLALAERFVDLTDLGLLHESAGRADAHALAALDARRVRKASVLGRGDKGLEASVLKAQDAEAVRVLASRDAAAAEDALGCVADKARSQLVEISLGVRALISALTGTRHLSDV